jgi:hypothetical protein
MAIATTVPLDAYLVDTLMPDLVGHDRKPSAFIVYLFLATAAHRTGRARVGASLQEIAVRTGLSKSAVQGAIRHLRRRGLLVDEAADSTDPARVVARPWDRRVRRPGT